MKIKGKVIKGSGDGKKIGFPTINIQLGGELDIQHGVYACIVEINKELYKGVMHYGPRLIFDETNVQCEVHILDFKKDIYGKFVIVEIKEFIRGTENFDSIEAMVEQIEKDVKEARSILKN